MGGLSVPVRQGKSQTPEAGSARLCRPEAYTTSLAFFLALQPEKFAPPELSKVELALDLAGWKPALLDGGTDAFL